LVSYLLIQKNLTSRREEHLKAFSDIDSKFRFVILASKRAKQLLSGAKPKIKSRSKNLIRIAQEEVRKGFVEFELVESKPEEHRQTDNEAFIGEELVKEDVAAIPDIGGMEADSEQESEEKEEEQP
jgi:DNA-directed RNA polymerase omega subunit